MARDFTFNCSSKNITGVANKQSYNLPYNCERIKNVKVVVGTLRYFPKEVTSRQVWTNLNRTVVSGNHTSRYFIEDDTIEVYPVPTSASPVITIYYQKTNQDYSATDYTTGSAYTTSASPTKVTGSPTTIVWASAMVGRFIQLEDGFWYEIDNVITTYQLIIARDASKVMTGSDYTISELVPLPYGYSDLPLYGALANYYQNKEGSIDQAREWERQYREGLERLLRRDAKSVGTVFEKSDLEDIIGLYDINKWPEDIS